MAPERPAIVDDDAVSVSRLDATSADAVVGSADRAVDRRNVDKLALTPIVSGLETAAMYRNGRHLFREPSRLSLTRR